MGKHGWLLGQLKDLAEYASLNGLPKISAAIVIAKNIAISDLTLASEMEYGVSNSSMELEN